MHATLILASIAFAAIAVFHGLRVRRGSFLSGLSLPRTEADRHAGGWLAFLVIKNPQLCHAVEALSRVLPGPRADVEGAVRSTTFTHLQSRTILHRYFRWQVHNIVRVFCGLLFCGVILVCATGSYRGNSLIALGSALLCAYALVNWRRIRADCEGTRKFCSRARATCDEAVDAFSELSRAALHQSVAFALVFVCNLSFQVLVLIDANDAVVFEASAVRVERAESAGVAPKALAG